MRKKWLKILGIGFSIIELTTNLKTVKAIEMETTAIPNSSITGYDFVGYGSFMKNNLNFKNSFDVVYTFSADNNISGYDYIQFPFIIQYNNTTTGTINGNSYSNVTDLWCTNWTERTQTYADGSKSTYSECSLWSTQVDPTERTQLDTFEQNTPNISIAIDIFYNNGKISPCELTSVNYGTTYMKCKVPSDSTNITRIRMRNQGSNYVNPLIGQLGIGNYYIKWKDPIKSVITELEEQQKVCNIFDKLNIKKDSKILNNKGEEQTNGAFGITDYIRVNIRDNIEVLQARTGSGYTCFYTEEKEKIECYPNSVTTLTIPSGTTYVRFTINKGDNAPRFQICNNGNQAINNQIENIQNQDISEESKEAPNQDAFNSYQNKENQIKQATSNADMSAINVAMDIPTSNWIWETMTRIFNTNPIIMSMIITFLSIGVIKLILRR